MRTSINLDKCVESIQVMFPIVLDLWMVNALKHGNCVCFIVLKLKINFKSISEKKRF